MSLSLERTGLNPENLPDWRGSDGSGTGTGTPGTGAPTNLSATASATNVVIASSTGADATLNPATSALAGLMTPTQVTKLAAYPSTPPAGTGAAVPTNLATSNRTATTLDVTSDTGTDATLPAATGLLAGLMSGADKAKLDGLSGVASGGGAPIYRKLTVVANGQTASVLVTGYGSAADLASATVAAAADGSAITVAGLPASFDIKDVTAHTPAGFNTGTAFSLNFPSPFSTTAIDDLPLPILMHWNIAAPAIEQAQTNINATVSAGGVITVQKTGLTAGTGARWKAIL